MAERSVTVRLKLDNSDFIAGMAQAAAAAKALQKILDGSSSSFDKVLGKTSKSADDFSASMDDASDSTTGFGKSTSGATSGLALFRKQIQGAKDDNRGFFTGLNTSNDRMSFLIQSSLALGPALVPTLAVAVPLVAALAAGLGFAATGAGVAVMAFSGVGDALKAMNDFALDPTVANMEKMNAAMDELGPAGQDFVKFLQSIRPEMQELQNIAQEGLLPGVQEGIEEVMTQLPLLEGMVETMSSALGDMAAEGGAALTSPFWTEFFTFLRDDTQVVISNFGIGLGKIVEGLAALMMTLQPLTDDWVRGFADMGRSFSTWAQNLGQTQGFTDFIAYVREAGPALSDALASIGNALVEVGKAAAGLGLVSLDAISAIFDAIAAIAASPAGPVLLAVAAGISAVSRAIALGNIVGGSTMLATLKGLPLALAGLSGRNMLGIAGGITALGLSFTEWDDNAGMSNFLTFGSAGLIFGPWGAALGLVTGAAMDAAGANDELADALGSVHAAMAQSPMDWKLQDDALQRARESLAEFKEDVEWGNEGLLGRLNVFNDWGKIKNDIEGLFGDSDVQEFTADTFKAAAALEEFRGAQVKIAQDLTGQSWLTDSLSDLPEVTSALELAGPAMDAMGVSMEELNVLAQSDDPWDAHQLEEYISFIQDYNANADTTAGRTAEVASAVSELDGVFTSAAAGADALSAALDALLSPQLDLQAATDAFTTGLRHWVEELKKSNRTLVGNSDAAIKNRDALRARVGELQTQVVAEAAAGATSEEFAQSLKEQRTRLIEAGVAAGLNRRQLVGLINTYGLTPKMVRTILEAKGIDLAINDTKRLLENYNALPKAVRTDIAANGVQADATVKSLMAKYEGLSRADAETIIKARDEASSIIDSVRLNLADLDGRTANTTVTTTFLNVGKKDPIFGATGGRIAGPGGPREDKVPAMLSDGEFVINAAATKQNLALLNQINAQKFHTGGIAHLAGGGQPGRPMNADDINRRAFHEDDPATIQELADALKEMRREAKDVTEAEGDVKAAREASKQAARALAEVENTNSQKYKERAKASREADKELEQAEKDLSKQRDELSEATDRWKDKQSELIAQAKAVQDSILSSGAIFGGEGTSVTVGGMLAKIRQAAEDAREFSKNIATLRARGLDENLIGQLLENAGTPEANAAAESLANASQRDLRRLNRAQGRLENVASQAGRFATDPQAGTNINITFTGQIRSSDKTLPDRITASIKRGLKVAGQA